MSLLSAPLRGFLFIVEEVVDRAERSLYGEEELRAALGDLHADWEGGRIDDQEFDKREAELIRRLAEAERRKRCRR